METMRYSEMMAAPLHGIRVVVDLTWDRRDRGREWLVVERGHTREGGYDVWTDTGRLVGDAVSWAGAKQIAGRASARARRQGVNGQYDIVRRGEVELRQSSAPYGCVAGEFSA